VLSYSCLFYVLYVQVFGCLIILQHVARNERHQNSETWILYTLTSYINVSLAGHVMVKLQSPAVHSWGLGFYPGPIMWGLRWTEWPWESIFSEYLIFLLLKTFYQCFILIFILILLRSIVRTGGWSLGTFKKSKAVLDMGSIRRKITSTFSAVQGLTWIYSVDGCMPWKNILYDMLAQTCSLCGQL
jgi:hypothetical protein